MKIQNIDDNNLVEETTEALQKQKKADSNQENEKKIKQSKSKENGKLPYMKLLRTSMNYDDAEYMVAAILALVTFILGFQIPYTGGQFSIEDFLKADYVSITLIRNDFMISERFFGGGILCVTFLMLCFTTCIFIMVGLAITAARESEDIWNKIKIIVEIAIYIMLVLFVLGIFFFFFQFIEAVDISYPNYCHVDDPIRYPELIDNNEKTVINPMKKCDNGFPLSEFSYFRSQATRATWLIGFPAIAIFLIIPTVYFLNFKVMKAKYYEIKELKDNLDNQMQGTSLDLELLSIFAKEKQYEQMLSELRNTSGINHAEILKNIIKYEELNGAFGFF